jgi:hypothetical protein
MNECEVPGSNNIDGRVELIRNVQIAMSKSSVVASALI